MSAVKVKKRYLHKRLEPRVFKYTKSYERVWRERLWNAVLFVKPALLEVEPHLFTQNKILYRRLTSQRTV